MTKRIIIAILIILAIPLFVNFGVAVHRLWNYPVASGVWVEFWASYLGAVIATATSFCVLWLSFREERKKEEWKKSIENYDNLTNDIADIMSKVDVTEITQGILSRKHLNVVVELNRLQLLYHTYLQLDHYLYFKYYKSGNAKMQRFASSYMGVIKEAIECINELSKFLFPITSETVEPAYDDFVVIETNVQAKVSILQQRYGSEVEPSANECLSEAKEKTDNYKCVINYKKA